MSIQEPTVNKRENFITALRGSVPHHIPLFEFHFGIKVIKAVLGEENMNSYWHNADDEVAMARATGLDMVWTMPLGFTALANIQLHGEAFTDEWGTKWGTNELSWPAGWPENEVIKSVGDWKNLKKPDPTDPVRMEQPRRTIELVDGELAVVAGIRGPWSSTQLLAGLVNMSLWLYDQPDFLDQLLREMSEWYTELGLQLIAAGVDAISIHDDWGMNKSTFIAPDDWRRFVQPHIARQVETLANTGTPIILHSDGNLNAIMDEISQLKIAALNPLQRGANMNLAEIKRKYGDRLALIGNLSTMTTLAFGTPDDVEREVLECIRDAGPGGGYILGPDHSYHSGIPLENILRAFATCKDYGKYPLDLDTIQARLEALSPTDVAP